MKTSEFLKEIDKITGALNKAHQEVFSKQNLAHISKSQKEKEDIRQDLVFYMVGYLIGAADIISKLSDQIMADEKSGKGIEFDEI